MSSEACGATTTPPTIVFDPGTANSLTKPSVMLRIFARGLVDSGSVTVRASILPSSTSVWL